MNVKTDYITVSSLKELLNVMLDEEISLHNEASAFLATAPEGCLCCDERVGEPYFRHRAFITDETGKRKSIDRVLGKDDTELMRELAKKSEYTIIENISGENIKGLRAFLKHYRGNTRELAFSRLSSAAQKILAEEKRSMESWMLDWMYAPYEKSNAHPEELIHTTLSGFMVRSKSEEKIADTLFLDNLAFRYEPKLIIGDEIRFPDFIILHPASTPEHMIFIIWEHAGKMDDTEKYVPDLCRKLMAYSEVGLVIGENIIFTFESRRHPLSTAQVKREIGAITSMSKGSPIVERNGCFMIAGLPTVERTNYIHH